MRSGLDPLWRRIAGLEATPGGVFAAVWLAIDRDTDTAHVYDACLWRDEVMAVMAEGISARGRDIPIAWPKRAKGVAGQLRERGLFILPEPVSDDADSREVATREINNRIRSHRMRADRRCAEWIQEYKSYRKGPDGMPPRDTHPIMAATQHAIMNIDYARAPLGAGAKKARYPQIPIL